MEGLFPVIEGHQGRWKAERSAPTGPPAVARPAKDPRPSANGEQAEAFRFPPSSGQGGAAVPDQSPAHIRCDQLECTRGNGLRLRQQSLPVPGSGLRGIRRPVSRTEDLRRGGRAAHSSSSRAERSSRLRSPRRPSVIRRIPCEKSGFSFRRRGITWCRSRLRS